MTAIGRIILAGIPLLLLGCAPRLDVQGDWVGYRDLPTNPGVDDVLAKNLAKVQLRVDDKGQFVLFERGLPKTGTVRHSGGEAYLDVIEVMRNPPKPGTEAEYENLRVAKGGAGTLLFRQPGVDSATVTLSRRQSE